jgi:Uma2 family endonuclease
VREHGLGSIIPSVSVHVHDELVFEPDVTFIRAERMSIADPEGHVHGVPDLAVEVLSPSNRSYDQNLKRLHYMECGLPELWLVDIDARSIEVWRPGADAPERVRDSIIWRVGDASFDLSFEEIFRGV